jgi:hypothetical protein
MVLGTVVLLYLIVNKEEMSMLRNSYGNEGKRNSSISKVEALVSEK